MGICISCACRGSVSSSVSAISTPVFAISPPASPDVSHQEAARQHQPADRVMAKSKGVVGRGLRCIFVYSWLLFKIVLGFTPRRRPWKAGPSQNDDFLPRFGIHPFWKALQGISIPKRFGTTLFRPLLAASGFTDVEAYT